MYNESADSNLGPFTVEAKLTSVGGAVLYAAGEGRVRLPQLAMLLSVSARFFSTVIRPIGVSVHTEGIQQATKM